MNKARRKVLVLQHLAVEHPGVFRDFLARDDYEYVPVELDEGQPIPRLEDYAALWVMGGPMDVWQEDAHPWLAGEKDAIRRAVLELDMPYLGFCLGHQLLAAALGGEVGLAAEAEVGILPVERTPQALDCPFMQEMPTRFDVMQWHSAEITRLPPGARVLASSPRCAVQALSVGRRAFSMQFHIEITPSTVPEWNAIPAYRAALEKSLGADGAIGLEAAAGERIGEFNGLAERIYRNWRQAAGFG
jgi:GMP synthase-like glutamine amidotransferase